jgi:hypothetical protein
MNLPRPFLSRSNPFRPAVDLLTDRFNLAKVPHSPLEHDSSGSSLVPEDNMSYSAASTPKSSSARSHHSRASSAEVDPSSGIPLIDFSRTPSPTPYRFRSRAQSDEDEDEEDYDDEDDEGVPLSLRPLVQESKGRNWWRHGGLGAFLFGSWAGWQVYVGLITAWNVSASILLVFFNRVILMCKLRQTDRQLCHSHPISPKC